MHINAHPPTLFRMILAMLYDGMLVTSCIIVLGFIAVALNHFSPIPPNSWKSYILFIAALILWCIFFAYFRSRYGQTLGMRAWRLMVVDNHNHPPSFYRAVLRWCTALISLTPLGLGLWWRFFNKQRYTLHDRLSQTRLILVEHNPYKNKEIK